MQRSAAAIGAAMATMATMAAWLIWGATAGWHWPDLLGVIPDDAFYYLEGARRAAETGTVSVDGVHTGTGYHPGWMLILAGVSRLTPSSEAFLVQSLLLSQVLFCIAAILMMRLLRHLLPDLAGLGAAVWLLSPLTLLLAVQTMEAGLFSCLLIVACSAVITGPFSDSTERVDPTWRLALAGAALGLAFYGRTETIVIAAVTFLFLPWRRIAIPALCFGIVILPWYLFLYSTTGSFVQASGTMKQLWAAEAWHRLGMRHLELVLRTPVGLGALASFAGLLVTLLWRRPSDRRAWRIACWAFSVCSVLSLVYVVRLTDHQIWHLAGLNVLGTIGVVALVVAHRSERWRFAAGTTATVVVVLVTAGVGWFVTAREVEGYPWQREVHAQQAGLEAWVPAGEPIAVINAGVPAYFSDRNIVAIDGLMNDSLVPYWQRHEVDVALRALGIHYLIDNETALYRLTLFSTAALVAEELHCVKQDSLNARLCVWRIQ